MCEAHPRAHSKWGLCTREGGKMAKYDRLTRSDLIPCWAPWLKFTDRLLIFTSGVLGATPANVGFVVRQPARGPGFRWATRRLISSARPVRCSRPQVTIHRGVSR